MTGKSLHRIGITALSASMAIIGLVLVVQAASEGGSGTIVRLLLGLLFVAAGFGRLYLLGRKSRGA